jgi:hypothetical protein
MIYNKVVDVDMIFELKFNIKMSAFSGGSSLCSPRASTRLLLMEFFSHTNDTKQIAHEEYPFKHLN